MSRDKAAGRGARRTPASLTQAIEENSIWHRLKRTLLLPVALCLLRALCSRPRLCRLGGTKCTRNKVLGTVRSTPWPLQRRISLCPSQYVQPYKLTIAFLARSRRSQARKPRAARICGPLIMSAGAGAAQNADPVAVQDLFEQRRPSMQQAG